MGGPHRGPTIAAPHNNGEWHASEMEVHGGETGASQCKKKHRCLKSDAQVVLMDNNIPHLRMMWDEKIADLVGGIPLELPPFREVYHMINLIDPEKQIKYCLPKCAEHFWEELSEKIQHYTTTGWWVPTVGHQAVPTLCVLKKSSKLRIVFDM